MDTNTGGKEGQFRELREVLIATPRGTCRADVTGMHGSDWLPPTAYCSHLNISHEHSSPALANPYLPKSWDPYLQVPVQTVYRLESETVDRVPSCLGSTLYNRMSCLLAQIGLTRTRSVQGTSFPMKMRCFPLGLRGDFSQGVEKTEDDGSDDSSEVTPWWSDHFP